ncbi:innexin unc-9-like isoform X2 [Pomacea canaliculata]|uniref:innexin unc-9-like isoform X2 n=1 Tax=Pomacea canaliculata TaxID=400727 RepID=UPI000D72BA8B|nr:innexin unc-9-like isoform X2 [Pomacea canaliculata]
MINTALGSISHLELHSTIRDDDGIDQLHHFVTVTLYVLCATVAGFKEYASEPITCWNYGQYMFPHYGLDALGAPEHDTKTGVGKITFYRWVTMLFLMQAFSFKFPNMIWRELNAYAGSNIVKIVQMLQDVIFAKRAEKTERLQQVALFLEQWLRIHRKPRWFMRHQSSLPYIDTTLSSCMMCIGTDTSNYLSTFYLMTKALYLLNTVMQFFILSIFLHTNFFIYGIRLLNSYSEGKSDAHSKSMFPTVVMCHFRTYQDHRTTGRWVQCVLTINLFLEQLFLIEWLWLLLLLTVTTFSFIVWCFKILQTQTALKFVRRYMRLMNFYCVPATASKSFSVEEFVTEYLRSDGVFVLRILSVNTNEVVVSELVTELWNRYLSFKINEVGQGSPTSSFQQEIPFRPDDRKVEENERETGPRSSTDVDTEPVNSKGMSSV